MAFVIYTDFDVSLGQIESANEKYGRQEEEFEFVNTCFE